MDKRNEKIKKLRETIKNNKKDIKIALESIDGLIKLTDRNFEIYEELQRGNGYDLRRNKEEIDYLKIRLMKLKEETQGLQRTIKGDNQTEKTPFDWTNQFFTISAPIVSCLVFYGICCIYKNWDREIVDEGQ